MTVVRGEWENFRKHARAVCVCVCVCVCLYATRESIRGHVYTYTIARIARGLARGVVYSGENFVKETIPLALSEWTL